MSIVRKESILYAVISGVHKERKCVTRKVADIDSKFIGILFADSPDGKILIIEKGKLVQLETPGWIDTHKIRPYDLSDYQKNKGTGLNMLRTKTFSQPRALKMRDVLSTGEVVTAAPRLGFNGSILIQLDESGWVELTPWLPIALQGNRCFKLPIELAKSDMLTTGDIVAKNSFSAIINWTSIFLERGDHQINVPSCIPLAIEKI